MSWVGWIAVHHWVDVRDELRKYSTVNGHAIIWVPPLVVPVIMQTGTHGKQTIKDVNQEMFNASSATSLDLRCI